MAKGAQCYGLPHRGVTFGTDFPCGGVTFGVLPVVVVDINSYPSSGGYPRQGGIRNNENLLDFFYILKVSPILKVVVFHYIMS